MPTKRITYGFGDLNPIEPSPGDKQKKDIYSKFNPLTSIYVGSNQALKPDSLYKAGTRYRAVVLRVEPKSQFLPLENGLRFSTDSTQIKNLVQIKARIPELHASLPEPAGDSIQDGPHQRIIDLYPTFVAQSVEISQMGEPAEGDIVWVTFGNSGTLTDGIYLGPVHDFGKKSGGSTPSTKAKGAFTDCAGNIPDTFLERAKKYIIESFSDSTYQSGSFLVLSKQQIKVPFEVVYRDASAVFGKTDRTKQIERVIVHHTAGAKGTAKETYNILSQRQLGTHFEVDKEGKVWQYIDPGVFVTYHAGGYNGNSIGIDLSGPSPDFTDIQMSRAVDLILVLSRVYNIPFYMLDYKHDSENPNPGLFGHVHLTHTGKPDPYGPRNASIEQRAARWQQLKQMIQQRSNLNTDFSHQLAKLQQSQGTVEQQMNSGTNTNSPCVQRLGNI